MLSLFLLPDPDPFNVRQRPFEEVIHGRLHTSMAQVEQRRFSSDLEITRTFAPGRN